MSGKEQIVTLECLSAHIAQGVGSASVSAGTTLEGKLKDALESVEREMISGAIKRCSGNKSEAARQLGISRSNLIAKAQSFGLE
jgi:DNA-binding NtrC family response regulator